MSDVIYWGLFLDDSSVQTMDDCFGSDGLERLVEDPHVTFAFRPSSIDRRLLGQTHTVLVTGYGNNGQNQGVMVDLGELRPLCTNEVPHITLSMGVYAKAKDTGGLFFRSISRPIPVSGTLGAFCKGGWFDFGDGDK